MFSKLSSKKILIAASCGLAVLSVIVIVLAVSHHNKVNTPEADEPDNSVVASVSEVEQENDDSEKERFDTETETDITQTDEDNTETETDVSEIEDTDIYSSDKNAYKFIGTKIVCYGYPCADGGSYTPLKGCYGYALSTNSDSDHDIARTLYITGYDHYIMNDLYTGKKYEYYTDRVKNLSSLVYDYSVFSYVCTFKEKINSNDVTVYLYFNSPDGKCTGAVISLLELKGKYTGSIKAENNGFLLMYTSLPYSEFVSSYDEIRKNKCSGASLYSNEGKNINLYVSDFSNEEDVSKYNDAVISSTSFSEKEDASAKKINLSDYEILPGVRFGDSYESIKSRGYGFFGKMGFSDFTGENMCQVVFRVGAANIESYVSFDKNNRLQAFETTFICKQLCG